jgi:hypothetical protein
MHLVVNLFWAVVAGRDEAADVEIESPPFDPFSGRTSPSPVTIRSSAQFTAGESFVKA